MDQRPDLELTVTAYAVVDRVATITLSRPERLNAWTSRMNTEYRHLLQRATDDPGVRVIVVTGAGRGFCAGAESDDLAGHAERGAYDAGHPDDLATPGYGLRPEFDAELAYHFGVPKPVIAAVNGPAAGIGFALACYCDLRFAASSATFTTAHAKLGLPCAFGLAWLLPRLVGLTRAMDLTLSSRRFTAGEATDIGLVNATFPDDGFADGVAAYATMLATTVAPASLAATKRQLYDGFHQSVADAVHASEALLTPMMGRPDYREGSPRCGRSARRSSATPSPDSPGSPPRQPAGDGLGDQAVPVPQAVVPAIDPHVGDRAGDGPGGLLELGRGGEGVPGTRHEEARHPDRGEVPGPQLLRPSRWMERVAHQDQRRRREPVGHGHRADPPTHGPAAQSHGGPVVPELPGQRPGVVHHRGQQHRRPVGGPPAGQAVGEIGPPHRHPERRHGPVDGHQGALVAARPGTGEQQQAGRRPLAQWSSVAVESSSAKRSWPRPAGWARARWGRRPACTS